MNKLYPLIKIQAKDFLSKTTNSLGIKNKLLSRLLLATIGVLLLLPAGAFSTVMYNELVAINQTELMITTFYINSVIFMFIFGMPFIISVFFFSKDAKFLSSLPVNEEDIVVSKLTTVYIYLLGISSLVFAPALIVYLINTGITLYLVLMVLIALIMAPMLPLLISAIVILPFGNLFSGSSRRKTLILIFNILILFVIIAFQLFFSNFVENPEQIQQMILSDGFVELVGMRFPPSIWLTRMFLGSITDIFLFLGLNVLLFFIIKIMARLFFRKALHSFTEDGGLSVTEVYYKRSNMARQLIKRNLLIILKEPMFLMNNGLSLIAPLLVFVMMLFTGEFSLELLKSPQLEPYLPIILTGILISPAVIGNISSTAITREGKTFWETRVLPISAEDNIKYRVLTTIILNLAASILLLVCSLFVLPISINMIIMALFLCITITPFFAAIDIIINIHRPLLDWTNPTAAVKNNLNVTLSLLIRVVIAGLIFLAYKIVPVLFQNIDILIWGSGILFLILYFIIKRYLNTKGAEKFNNISL